MVWYVATLIEMLNKNKADNNNVHPDSVMASKENCVIQDLTRKENV